MRQLGEAEVGGYVGVGGLCRSGDRGEKVAPWSMRIVEASLGKSYSGVQGNLSAVSHVNSVHTTAPSEEVNVRMSGDWEVNACDGEGG